MDEDREARIRHRAYHIWQEEGCPDDREHEHWLRAEREIASTEAASDSGASGSGTPGEAGEPPAAAQGAPRRRTRGGNATGSNANQTPTEKVNDVETLTPATGDAQPAPKPTRRGRRTAEAEPG